MKVLLGIGRTALVSRTLDIVQHPFDLFGDDIVYKTVNRAEVLVERLPVNIRLARDGAHGNVFEGFFQQKALESVDDEAPASNDPSI